MTISPRERRLLLLLGLLVAAAGLRWLWLAASTPPPPAAGASQVRATRSGRSARGGGEAPPTAVVELQVDRLNATPGDFEVGRDLFRYGPPPPPPEPPLPTKEELEQRRRAEEEARRRAEAAAIEARKPRPPRVTLRYLGSFGPEKAKIAVFTDQAGKSVWNARVGDIVEGKFIVAAIGLESVDLKFVGFENVPPARLAVGE